MSDAIFCKFDHETTLQANGRRIRFFRGGHMVSSFDYELSRDHVVSAVHLYEGVAHLLTTGGVYEVTAHPDCGVIFKNIGPILP